MGITWLVYIGGISPGKGLFPRVGGVGVVRCLVPGEVNPGRDKGIEH